MKSLKKTVFLLFLLGFGLLMTCQAQAADKKAEKVGLVHYRIWQGFSLAKYNNVEFMNILATKFVPDTASITPEFGMKNYLVIIPPATCTEPVAHEIALLKYTSEDDYKTMFKSEAGRNYANSHWDVFAREESRSLVAKPFTSVKREYFPAGFAYDVIGKEVEWHNGNSWFYLGKRNKSIKSKDFMEKMPDYIAKVKAAFSGKGLEGYIVVITPELEMAFMNWKSEADMNRCYKSEEGEKIIKEADKLLTPIMWQQMVKFSGELRPGEAYLVK